MRLAPAGATGGRGRLPAAASRAVAPAKTTAPGGADGDFSLVVDLGASIGSRDWLRGLGTLIALCWGALQFWPDMSAVRGPVPASYTDLEAEEAAAFTIAPIAQGSATGRHSGPTDAVQPALGLREPAAVELRAILNGPGDLTGALARAGVSQGEARQVAALVSPAVPLADVPAGTMLDIRLGRRERPSDPRPLERLSFRAGLGQRIEISRVGGVLTMARTMVAIDSTPLRIQGAIGPSLYRSARAAGVPARIVETYIRILASQVGIPSGIGPTDRFDMVIEHRRAATGEVEVGDLLYVGLERADGRAVRMMPWASGGASRWFEASGVGRETSSGFRSPVPNGRLTSPFGGRVHPILRYVRMHTGLDIGAPYGSQIVAASGGQVVTAGWSGGYGRSVRIDHGGGISTLYGHMSGLTVAAGQRVAPGQLIGYVGSSGLSTGPHLHFEVRRGGVPINPAGFAFTRRADLSGTELEQFRARMRGLLALPPGSLPVDAGIGPVSPVSPVRPVPRPGQTPTQPQPNTPPPPPQPGQW